MTEVNPPAYLQGGVVSHPARIFRLAQQAVVTDGVSVFNPPNDLKVSQSAVLGMKVDVDRGGVWFARAGQTDPGRYLTYNDAVKTVNLSASDPTNPRIDIIIARVNDTQYGDGSDTWLLDKVDGTPAPSPAVPATPNNAYKLAEVAVAAAATQILNANITDKRATAKSNLVPDFPAVRVFKTSNQAVTTGDTGAAITMQTVVFDWTTAMYSGGASTRLTFQQAGIYMVGGQVRFAADSGGTFRRAALKKNGSEKQRMQISVAPSGANIYVLQVSSLLQVIATDFVELWAAHNKGSDLNVEGSTEDFSNFWAVRVA